VTLLAIPEILEAQGLIPDSALVHLELEKPDGGSLVVEIPAEPRQQHSYLDAGPGPDELPLYRQRSAENYWLQYLEGSQALYVHYRQAQEMSTESFAAFTSRVVSILDAEPVRTLVIDVRNNTGGNSAILEPLLVALERRPSFSSGDGLYTIIGRATFSSGLMNAFDLKRRTRAILVGEPTGGKPNHYGQVSSLTLAYSRLRVSYSTRFFRLLQDSDPPSLEPDERVELTSEDYVRGRDPVLETVFRLAGS
jgi:C-terminal processing protease CtpA/Prc